jgi:hypothetical protein
MSVKYKTEVRNIISHVSLLLQRIISYQMSLSLCPQIQYFKTIQNNLLQPKPWQYMRNCHGIVTHATFTDF